MTRQTEVVVTGGGIAGLAHAWTAARLGYTVTVLERSGYAKGASIRNFGMVWPVGQKGADLATAMRSRELWLEAAEEAGFWHSPVGSIHLAVRDDELAVMKEFADSSEESGYTCEFLSTGQLAELSPVINKNRVIGGLYSRTEVGVDPREAIPSITEWLADHYGVRFEFDTYAIRCESGVVHCANGRSFEASERVIICNGSETGVLFPGLLESQGAIPCKLQMFSTTPQRSLDRRSPLIASGASLRHYQSFASCPSLPDLKARFAAESPELDQYGIHFMASQNREDRFVLGDSHEYGREIQPFDSQRIEELIVKGLQDMIVLPNFEISQRWHGVYLKAPGKTHLTAHPMPGVTVFNALGGGGMTRSFGLAEQMWASDLEPSTEPLLTA